jgi:hypothetical protein
VRDLYNRLGTVNKVGLFGAFIGFSVGMAAVIIVDPLRGSVIVAVSIALVIFCFWFFFGREVTRSRILKSGEPAEATILEVRSTGKTINEVYPEIELLLEVQPREGEPYRAKARCLIDQVGIPAFQPGNRIAVTIDPKHRKKIAVQR